MSPGSCYMVVDKCVRQSDRRRWLSDPRRQAPTQLDARATNTTPIHWDHTDNNSTTRSLVKLSVEQQERSTDRRPSLTVNEDTGRSRSNNDLIELPSVTEVTTCHSIKWPAILRTLQRLCQKVIGLPARVKVNVLSVFCTRRKQSIPSKMCSMFYSAEISGCRFCVKHFS